jgi:hypothetical protein
MTFPPQTFIFVMGCAGSLSVEIIDLYAVYQQEHISIPERYKRVGYYIVRLALTIIAGSVALAYKIENPLLAINIGAATPVLIQTFARGLTAANKAAIAHTQENDPE